MLELVKKKKDRPAVICGGPIDTAERRYTAVILGMQRSGTTMVAGVAQRCGLFIGSNLPINLEDPDFSHAPILQMRESIKKRNEASDAWGWKYPAAARYLDKLMPDLRNPRLIVVWRDLVAVAGRRLAKREDWLSSLTMGHRTQTRNLNLISSVSCPILLVSYERATRFPLEFTEILSDFLALAPPKDRDELLQFMAPGTYKQNGESPSLQGADTWHLNPLG